MPNSESNEIGNRRSEFDKGRGLSEIEKRGGKRPPNAPPIPAPNSKIPEPPSGSGNSKKE